MNIITIYESAIGPFVGVFLGFIVNYAYQSYKNNQDKNKYKSMIRSEIRICIKSLAEGDFKQLPRDHWISAVNSGALKLFEVEKELKLLTIQYNKIQNYNESISIIGRAYEDEEKEETSLKEKHDSLLKELEILESENWLEAKSWWQFWR